MNLKIGVVGLGYVGLSTSFGFALKGHNIFLYDIDRKKLDLLNTGKIPIEEKELKDVFPEITKRINIVYRLQKLHYCDIIFICVDTPMDSDGSADFSSVLNVATELVKNKVIPRTIVIRSTVPLAAIEAVKYIFRDKKMEIVYNPEFLREGHALTDFLNPSRIVLGTENKKTTVLFDLYKEFHAPIINVTIATALLIKYASNVYLAMRVSFINEIEAIAEYIGADIYDVIEGLGFDKRIGKKYLSPGPGYGGSCLPKDTMALVRMSEEAGYYPYFIESIHRKNEQQIRRTFLKIKKACGNIFEERVIAVLGLAFKKDSCDMRNSVALRIVEKLKKEGAIVKTFDKCINTRDNLLKVVESSNVIVILNADDFYFDINWEEIANYVKSKVVVDPFNKIDKSRLIGWKVY